MELLFHDKASAFTACDKLQDPPCGVQHAKATLIKQAISAIQYVDGARRMN